ncbi:hypothetical protein DY000_02030902 [Brassica cretica]|uniref:Reverse transcriptase zinc-binding domain-containing protein n=1 Tax=Brassica cretica TaxID=69181 RepID=A0ABQ7DIE2_BRACR|nr:hypothetical protein DY000_02030902 [Brassica cretica]
MLLDRGPTRDHLISWGIQTDPLCLLCNRANESRDHLYFDCSFSTSVWSHFASRLQINFSSSDWEDVTHSLLSLTTSRHHKNLSYLSWQATV